MQSIREHEKWIASCADSPIDVKRSGIILYGITLGANADAVLRCLLSDRVTGSAPEAPGKWTVVAYPSPFDVVTLGDGPQRQMREVLIRTDRKAFIVSGAESDVGVTDIEHESEKTFLVHTSYASHSRAYRISGNTGHVAYLGDGTVNSIKQKENRYLVKDRKSYLNNAGGAFWFDALIDSYGNIIDIITPRDETYVVCMDRDQLARKSNLDLTKVDRQEVCIRR